jgi:hypothetical protein
MPDIVGGIIGIGFLVLWFYCIYDVITTEDAMIRHLPKIVWLLIVIVLADLGSILWLVLGRPTVWARQAHDPNRYRAHPPRTSRSPAPEAGSVDHLSPIVRYREEQTRLNMLEAQRRRREEELRRQPGEGPGS